MEEPEILSPAIKRAWEAYYRRYPTLKARKHRDEELREEAERERGDRYEKRGGVPWTP